MSIPTIRTAENDYYITVQSNLMAGSPRSTAPLTDVVEPTTLFKLFEAAYARGGQSNAFYCTIQQVGKNGANRFYTYRGNVVDCQFNSPPRRDAALDILYSGRDLANTKYKLDTYNPALQARVKVLFTRVVV